MPWGDWLRVVVVLGGVGLGIACSSEPPSSESSFGNVPSAKFEVLEPGAGPINEAPLEPLTAGTRMLNGRNRRMVLAARGDGVIEVRKTAGLPYTGRFAKIFFRRSAQGVEYLGADNESAPNALLLVPTEVREGMSWRTGGGAGVVLSVTSRSEEETVLGPSVVWTIEGGSQPLRYIEGVGPLDEGALGGVGSGSGYRTLVVPATDSTSTTVAREVAVRDVQSTAALSERLSTFEADALTALQHADGSLTLTLASASLELDFDGRPQQDLASASLHYQDGMLSLEATELTTQLQLIFPFQAGPARTRVVGDLELAFDDRVLTPTRSDGSGVYVNDDGTALHLIRDGYGMTYPFRTLSGTMYPAMFVESASGEPWALVTAEGFLWQRLQDGAGRADGTGGWSFGPGASSDWGPSQIFSFAETDNGFSGTINERVMGGATKGHWFAPVLPVLGDVPVAAYHVTIDRLLIRTTLTEHRIGKPEVLFAIPESIHVKTTPRGHEVLVTNLDGSVRRLVLEVGRERIETLGRMQLGANERLIGAVESATVPGDVIGVVAKNTLVLTDPVSYTASARFVIASFGTASTSAFENPPGLSVTAVRSGADVVVCWGETALEPTLTGWTLGGRAATAHAIAGHPCVLVVRDRETTASEFAAVGAFAIEGSIPDVGRVRIGVENNPIANVGTPSLVPNQNVAMFGDEILTRVRGWNVLGMPSRVDIGFYDNRSTLVDDIEGLWSRDQDGRLYFTGTVTEELHPTGGEWASDAVFEIVGPVLGGGVLLRATSTSTGEGPHYVFQRDGSLTRAVDPPEPNLLWLPDGNYCTTNNYLRCYTPGTALPTTLVAPVGETMASVSMRSFGDGTHLGRFGTRPYRVDLAAQTATAIGDGVLVGEPTRAADGSLWAAVVRGPTDLGVLPARIARIRPDGIDVYDIGRPGWLSESLDTVRVFPGETTFLIEFTAVGPDASFVRIDRPINPG